MVKNKNIGKVYRVAGPVVVARGLHARMYDVVRVSHEKLMGEVIEIDGDNVIIQVYEDTQGIKPGEPVECTGMPLSVELGPGILTMIYDGIQRPLDVLSKSMGDYIERGGIASALDRDKKWRFKPSAGKGDAVKGGSVIGEVEEQPGVVHKIMVPPLQEGKIVSIKSGDFTIDDVIGKLSNGFELKLAHKWPIRVPRPYMKKQKPKVPLITGQRIVDSLFPVAKGGTAAIPGPFGAGKTVLQQALAKWADADIIVYIGCGERGNEMTEVLTEFPKLKDAKTGRPLMQRTVLIANTSNMPVAAREASIYTGITLAEYYRDMGYDVALMADSTSRWAEAMREISSRLEEMPGEEGFPAYLAQKLANFYERSGVVRTMNKEEGSVTIIGAVSPPGGDFSEPVTQNTLRITKVFWALDANLANRRHYPSINWLESYSLYHKTLGLWFNKNIAGDWTEMVNKAMRILQEEEKLQEILQLVGSDALPDRQRLVLDAARMLREYYLQQNSFDDVDMYCGLRKQYAIIRTILDCSKNAEEALERGVPVEKLLEMDSKKEIYKLKFEKDYEPLLKKIQKKISEDFRKLKG